MVGDDGEPNGSNDLPLDDSVYIPEEEDTMEKMKRGLKKFGKDMKKGAGDIADSSKKFATKSKEKYEAAREERKKAKAMKDPLKFPWSTLSVVELKENLKGLGLKVSGKKDDLIERIKEHYRTEIPEKEDGTPQLIEDLEPFDDTPEAPDIDELIKEESEVVEELTPTFEKVNSETQAIQFEGSEQLYVYAPPKKIKLKKDYSYKVINYVNFLFGLSMFYITLCILNKGFDFGWNVGFIYDFIANRFVRSYGGMSDVQITSLSGVISLTLLFSSLMYFSGRQSVAALLVVATVFVSISTRAVVAFYAGDFANQDELFYLILDVVLAIPFCFSVWIPSILRSSLEYDAYQSSYLVNPEPKSITDGTSNEQLGDGMGRFEVDRPLPPKRRKIGQGTMYELLFLLFSIVLWPISIGVSALLILNYPTRHGSWTIEEHSLLLIILYAVSFFCSLIVYRIDKEARSGEIYAKEKLAYHRDMDQYLELKRVYYESAAAKVAGNNDDNE